MSEIPYPEVRALLQLQEQHDIKIKVIESDFSGGDLQKVVFCLGPAKYLLYLEDEYEDFKRSNTLLHLFLVLLELEELKGTKNAQEWSKQKMLKWSNSKLLSYYDAMHKAITAIEQKIGTIDAQIPSLDYQLNSGAIQYLRNTKS